MKSGKYGIAFIVLVPIALVAGPVLSAGIRNEIAHWYLAAAANAIELGNGDAKRSIDAEKAIESARAWDPEIGKLQDYLNVRLQQYKAHTTDLSLEQIFEEVPEESKLEIAERLATQYRSKGDFPFAANVLQVLLGKAAKERMSYWEILILRDLIEVNEAKALQTLRDAIAAEPRNIVLAPQFVSLLEKREDFNSTLEAYKLYYGEKYDRTVSNLNSLAYARALANVELDQALIDINEALGYHPEVADLRDTRAWVYYQMGRYEEALVDADFSVKAKELPSLSNWWEGVLEWLLVTKDSSETSSTEQEVLTSPVPASELTSGKFGFTPSENDPPIVMLDPPKKYLTRSKTSIATWSRGVLRYHRAQILEKLGRVEEAEIDWKWIEGNQLPPDERLH